MKSRLFLGLYFYLWIIPHLVLPVVAVVMLRKKLHKEYPIFFCYLVFEFLQFCILLTVPHVRLLASYYVQIDIFDRIGDAALFFGVIQELVSVPVKHDAQMRDQFARVVRGASIGLMLLGFVFIAILCYSGLNPSFCL